MTPATVAAAPSIFRDLRLAAADIKLAHSVFAFPYAILACFLARPALARLGSLRRRPRPHRRLHGDRPHLGHALQPHR
jgi:hypothetical protein